MSGKPTEQDPIKDSKQDPVAEAPQDEVTNEALQAEAVEACEESAESGLEENLEEQLEAALKKADENWDIALRTKAEMENIKRRSEQEVDKARKFALEKFANELLSVRDSMEMGLEASKADGADITKIVEGTELTSKMLSDVMAKFGVVQLNPVGEPFNPDHHQAISMQPSPEHDNNTVTAVMQKGYLLNDRLLRPAMVIVAKN